MTVLLAVDTTSSNVPSPAPAASTENVIGMPNCAGDACPNPLIVTRETSKTLQLNGDPAMCCSPLDTLEVCKNYKLMPLLRIKDLPDEMPSNDNRLKSRKPNFIS